MTSHIVSPLGELYHQSPIRLLVGVFIRLAASDAATQGTGSRPKLAVRRANTMCQALATGAHRGIGQRFVCLQRLAVLRRGALALVAALAAAEVDVVAVRALPVHQLLRGCRRRRLLLLRPQRRYYWHEADTRRNSNRREEGCSGFAS